MKILRWGNIISGDLGKKSCSSTGCADTAVSASLRPGPCPALQMPTAHGQVPPWSYRKEKHLFFDMRLLHYTSETFICKRSMKTEDPCFKTGYKSFLRTKKSFLKLGMFLNHIPPPGPDTAGGTARTFQGEYFTSRKENNTLSCRVTLLRQGLFWIAEQSENITKNLKKKKKVELKYLY